MFAIGLLKSRSRCPKFNTLLTLQCRPLATLNVLNHERAVLHRMHQHASSESGILHSVTRLYPTHARCD
jgi:hypothetical protein